MNVVQAIKDVNSVLSDMSNIVARSIISNDAEIIDLNISQLAEGMGASGKLLPEYSSDEYYAAKKAEGLTEKAGRHYNMLLDGDLRSGMYIEARGGYGSQAWIDSTDDKTSRMEDLTNVNIFGIAPKNHKKLIGIIAPDIKKQILNKIIK